MIAVSAACEAVKMIIVDVQARACCRRETGSMILPLTERLADQIGERDVAAAASRIGATIFSAIAGH